MRMDMPRIMVLGVQERLVICKVFSIARLISRAFGSLG